RQLVPKPYVQLSFLPTLSQRRNAFLPAAATTATGRSTWTDDGGGKDPVFLAKGFSLLNLNHQQPGGNRDRQTSKGLENNLYNQYEEKVQPCSDLIDSLRALDVEQGLVLPAIAVTGDQSSGKRSVLEALSGVALPRGSGKLCRASLLQATRHPGDQWAQERLLGRPPGGQLPQALDGCVWSVWCPLVLKLTKPECKWTGRISGRKTELQVQDPSAQDAVAGNGVGISHELISLEITSPEVPDLTLLDLPGIPRVAVGNQPHDVGLQMSLSGTWEWIKALVKKYIQRQQTINLVVVPCNVDIATTEALSMAQEVDPDGDRTIGILTKPDLVDKGAEKGVLKVMQDLTYHLKRGYMIVKRRGQQEVTNKLSLAEATKEEMMFFQTHPHFRATEELRQCGDNLPSNEAYKMFFLIEKIKVFNQDIEKLIEGEEIVKEKESRLYDKIREEFKNWILILAANTQKGKELLGFVNYKTLETIVKQYLEQLVDPALEMLQKAVEIIWKTFTDTAKKNFGGFSNLNQTVQISAHSLLNKIEDIKAKQAETAENLIRLQFRMEQLIYCQDQIYSVVLNRNLQSKSPLLNDPPSFSSIVEIWVHLNAYF
ncbi:hypothetical protein EI555_012542, partial [Monodon monoceros]